MSGVAVIVSVLLGDTNVTGAVSTDSIAGGDLPINTALPGISVKQIDSMPWLSVSQTESERLHTERVQVTVLAKTTDSSPSGGGYPLVKSILKNVLVACHNRSGTVNGIKVDSILPDVEGPDLLDEEEGILSQSRDFIVRYRA